MSECSKDKIRKTLLGRPLSEAHRRSLSLANIRRYQDPSERLKQSLRQRGKKQSEEGRRHINESLARPETREKMRRSHLGIRPSQETREKRRRSMIRYMETHPGKYKNTGPERKVKGYLRLHKIKYRQSLGVGGCLVDFYIPAHRTVIEVDGCWYHACPIHWPEKRDAKAVHSKDRKRSRNLKRQGFEIIRIWEHEINSGNFKKLESLR